jgi:hypothetical protein
MTAFAVTSSALDYQSSNTGLNVVTYESGRSDFKFGDVNGDGNVDIVSIGDHGSPNIGTNEHGIMVYFGDGHGNWTVTMTGNFGYGGATLGDVNNDGFMDVAYGCHHNYSSSDFGNEMFEVALGNGTGMSWTPWDDGLSQFQSSQDWYGKFGTDLGDVNNDGLLDAVANSFGSGTGVHAFLNNGNGTWTTSLNALPANRNTDMLVDFCDFNNDGNLDIASGYGEAVAFLGDGQGGWTNLSGSLPIVENTYSTWPTVTAGDVNGDGGDEFCYRSNASGGVFVMLRWDTLTNALVVADFCPPVLYNRRVQLCDMNGDGRTDLVVGYDGVLRILVQSGDPSNPTWTEAYSHAIAGFQGWNALRVGGDVDHNGYPDIAAFYKVGDVNRLEILKETTVATALSIRPVNPNGNETFHAGAVRFLDWAAAVPAADSVGRVDIWYSLTSSTGPWLPAAQNLPNNGRYQWTVPNANSQTCFLKYRIIAGPDTAVSTTTTPFRIVGSQDNPLSPFDLLSPADQSARTYHFGDTVLFVWQACHHTVPDTVIHYALTVQISGGSVDTSFSVADLSDTTTTCVLTNAVRYGTNTEWSWYVTASTSSGMTRQSTSTFSFTLLPGPTPASFNLISPANGATIPRDVASHLPLTWEQSTMADTSAPPLSYTLSLHPAGLPDTIYTVDNIADTTVTVDVLQYLSQDTAHVQVTWWVTAVTGNIRVECNQRRHFVVPRSLSAGEDLDGLPQRFTIASVSPNPFNAAITIRYDVERAGLVSLKVFDPLGRDVATLVQGVIPAGAHSIVWNAGALPSGVYLCRMEAGGFVQTQKMVLVK